MTAVRRNRAAAGVLLRRILGRFGPVVLCIGRFAPVLLPHELDAEARLRGELRHELLDLRVRAIVRDQQLVGPFALGEHALQDQPQAPRLVEARDDETRCRGHGRAA